MVYIAKTASLLRVGNQFQINVMIISTVQCCSGTLDAFHCCGGWPGPAGQLEFSTHQFGRVENETPFEVNRRPPPSVPPAVEGYNLWIPKSLICSWEYPSLGSGCWPLCGTVRQLSGHKFRTAAVDKQLRRRWWRRCIRRETVTYRVKNKDIYAFISWPSGSGSTKVERTNGSLVW